jgi:predicted Zn-dependent protease
MFSLIKTRLRTGDREGAIALAEKWRRLARRSSAACYFEYWARVQYRERKPGEYIDLLREAQRLSGPYSMNTSVNTLAGELIRMYAAWGKEEHALEAEQILTETHERFGPTPWELDLRADLAYLRGNPNEARRLRAESWELQPRKNAPHALLYEAMLHVDAGDRKRAIELLTQAANGRFADETVHGYLSALLEATDDKASIHHREAAHRLWKGPAEEMERKLQSYRQRIEEGPFADLREPSEG